MGKRYYDNYDYEEAYKEQCKKLEEAEMERWMKEGWVNCLYRTSTYKSTNTESNTTLLESMVYPSFKFKADMPKTEKKRETSPSQSNLNDKNARRYLIRLANINFGKGDIWATFGWNNGLLPETYEDAKKDVVNFIRRINRKRKKLTPREIGYGNRIDFVANLLQYATLQTRETIGGGMFDRGALTINEYRELMYYGPVEDGDQRLVSLNYVKVGDQSLYQVGQQNEPPDDTGANDREKRAMQAAARAYMQIMKGG